MKAFLRSKIKCLGERPTCSRCYKRNLSCLYEQDRIPTARATSQDGETSGASPASADMDGGVRAIQSLDVSHLLASTLQEDLHNPTPSNVFTNNPVEAYLSVPFAESDMQTQLDWIFYDSFDHVFPNPIPLQMLPLDSGPLGTSGHAMTLSQEGDIPEQQQADSLHPLPYKGRAIPQDIQNSQIDDRVVCDDRWPVEGRISTAQLSTLPSLKDTHDQAPYMSHFSLPPVSDSALAHLRSRLEALSERSPWQPISLTTFPSKEQMDYFIDLYFTHFDRVQLQLQYQISSHC